MTDLIATIAQELTKHVGPKVKTAVESTTRAKILASSASEILTFITPDGTRYSPSVSTDYAKALWCFVRGKSLNGIDLDSAVTKPISTAVEDAVIAELNSEAARSVVTRAVVPQTEVKESVRTITGNEAEAVAGQIMSTIGFASGSVIADQVAAAAAGSAADVLGTAAGKAVVAGIVQVAMTGTGQALVAKMISVSAAKVAGTTMLKVGVVSALKKVGIMIIIKMVIVKLLAALLPGVVAAKIPLFWIFLPIIGAFIYREMTHIPQKLAAKLPNKVSEEVGKSFPAIAENFARMILSDVVMEVSRAHRER